MERLHPAESEVDVLLRGSRLGHSLTSTRISKPPARVMAPFGRGEPLEIQLRIWIANRVGDRVGLVHHLMQCVVGRLRLQGHVGVAQSPPVRSAHQRPRHDRQEVTKSCARELGAHNPKAGRVAPSSSQVDVFLVRRVFCRASLLSAQLNIIRPATCLRICRPPEESADV
eukprot:3709413-Prymnesium_polylepis.1